MAADDKQLADLLRAAITASGQSQYALAKATGVSQGRIGGFLRGESDLSLGNAGKLAAVLGLSLLPTSGKSKAKRASHARAPSNN